MDEKEQKILDTFGKVIPLLTEKEKARVLDMGELMVFLKGGTLLLQETVSENHTSQLDKVGIKKGNK